MALTGRTAPAKRPAALARATVLALLAALLPPGPGAAATFADGQRAYEARRYEEAGAIWGPLAAAGDAEAQLGLGLLHDLGEGVPMDPGAAYAWYRRAAEAGLPAAQFNVGVMEDSGRVVPRDAAQAAAWYARAAAHDHARAEYNLGQLYAAGDGVPRNLAVAAAWYRAAAWSGLAAAEEKLDQLEEQAGADPVLAPASAALPHGGLVPVTPAVPAPEALIAARGGGPVAVELAWAAPAQPVRTRFFVEVMALAPEGSTREVFAAYFDESAALVWLEATPARYAWRVHAVGDGIARYATGEWRRFMVVPPGEALE